MAGDPRFFTGTGAHSLAAIAAACGARVAESADGARMLARLDTLAQAGPDALGFLDNRRYLPDLAATRAGAVILHPRHEAAVPQGTAALLTEAPYLAWARAASLFHPAPAAIPGVHPSATVDPSAAVDPTAEIGPGAVVGARARIGAACRIGPNAVIGDGVELGPDCIIGPNASVTHAILGARVRIYAGARIGEAGFGFATGPAGLVTVPQLGRVLIEDDVEVGANSTIDRGAGPDTVIGAGTRIDNLVQIGHNVRLGRCCVVVAMAGISGSTQVGDFVQIAAQAGLTGHLTIGAKARIGAQAGVMNDVPAGQDVIGSPAEKARDYFKYLAVLRRMVNDRNKGRSPEREEGAS
jgi:UDP-3-O-[3-hydroxymyristoyl] glucosamine N-acyltransferase